MFWGLGLPLVAVPLAFPPLAPGLLVLVGYSLLSSRRWVLLHRPLFPSDSSLPSDASEFLLFVFLRWTLLFGSLGVLGLLAFVRLCSSSGFSVGCSFYRSWFLNGPLCLSPFFFVWASSSFFSGFSSCVLSSVGRLLRLPP